MLKRLAALAFSVFMVSLPAHGGTVVASWNMEWLTTEQARLPEGKSVRDDAAFAQMAAFAKKIGADVYVLQEVDGAAAAAKVFDPRAYDLLVAEGGNVQSVVVAVRKGVKWQRHPDVDLDIRPDASGRGQRNGVDVTLSLASGPLRVLGVHLKSGCFDDRTRENPFPGRERKVADACSIQDEQAEALSAWIAAREAAGENFMVVGDFNRRFSSKDSFWRSLSDRHALWDLGWTQKSECHGGKYPQFIDHVVVNRPFKDKVGAFDEVVYAEHGAPVMADHCPITVRVAD